MGKVIMSGIVEPLTVPSNLPLIGTALNDLTWEEISMISNAGVSASYFSVGDTKGITINGTVGNTKFSNLSIDVYIIGIDHNSTIEGTNRIHFQIGKINGVNVALCDNLYNQNAANVGYFHIHTNSDGGGSGWKNCNAYTSIFGNNGTPSAPVESTLMSALPDDLLSVLKSVQKYADALCAGTNSTSAVVASTDYLWLLSEFEVFGKRSLANQYERNYQKQYDYYKAGNSKVKYKHNGTTTSAIWWTRSPSYNTSGYFCVVNNSGVVSSSSATNSFGIAPAFTV